MSNLLPKINVFISYCHDDEDYFKVFNRGLRKVTSNAEHFEWNIWDDTKIHVGTFWDDEIQNNIKDCDVALLLVSVGFMASKYIKEKEFEEFKKHYANKGILIVPIVFKPCDFNRWEDLGKLQFFKPNGVDYEKANLENFTYADLIKFRETDALLIPNPNIDRYHLNLAKKIEDSYKDFLSKKKDLKIPIICGEVATPLNKLFDYPKPSSLFTGRENELERFNVVFTASRIFAIEGLGGVGKTQFISKCIEKFINDKDKIIWLNGSVQSKFDVFVENSGYGVVLKGEKKTDLELYSGLKDLIEKGERIIFWDNFNDYEDIAFSKFLSFVSQYIYKATIVLITKTDPSIYGITSLPIVRVEGLNDDAIRYAKKLKASNENFNSISDSDLEKICISVEGHPLAIELSMLLMRYGKSANDIMLHLPAYTGIKKVEEFSKRLFFDIFNHPKTTDDERECFLVCSVFKEKIIEDEIRYVYEGKDVFYLLAGLINKLLFTFKDGYYEIHPLVRSFSYEQLTNKKEIHKKAANYFISQRSNALNPSLEEKIFYHLSKAEDLESIANSIEVIGKPLIYQGQLGLVSEFINKLKSSNILRPIFDIFYGDISQIKGEWDVALSHFEKASVSNNFIVKAEGIIKYGEIHLRRGDVNESLPYFEKAYLFSKENNLRKEEARALNNIGIVNYELDKLDIAYEKLTSALKIRIEINDVEGLSTSYNNLANLFEAKNKYGKALEYHNKSLKIAEDSEDKVGQALSFMNIGSLLRKQKKYAESLSYVNKALSINNEIGDKAGIAYCLNTQGLIYLAQRKSEESYSKLHESLKIRLEIGDKLGIATCFHNIGGHYYDKKMYKETLYYFFKALSIQRKIRVTGDEKTVLEWINSISLEIGKIKFKDLAYEAHNELDEETQKHIQIKEFLNEPQIRESPKVGRNDPCPCGSHKKYKQCHGLTK